MARVGLTSDKVARLGAELADEVGFDHVTISEVARRSGVSVASLYSHVTGLDDLRHRIAAIALHELAERGGSALAGRARLDALVALGDVYRDYAGEHPGRYDASRFPVPAAEASAHPALRHAQMMRAVLRGYDLTADAQTHGVRLVGSVFHGFISLERSGGFAHSEPSSQDSWTAILQSLDTMLRAWPSLP